MALTDIQKIKLEIGLTGEADNILTDSELEYFLEKNNNSIRKASLDAAKTVLMILSQLVHERTAGDLEIWGHTWFENYMKALQLYIHDPNFSFALSDAKAYAGGISVADARANIENSDNITVTVDTGIPRDYEASNSINTLSDVFGVRNTNLF